MALFLGTYTPSRSTDADPVPALAVAASAGCEEGVVHAILAQDSIRPVGRTAVCAPGGDMAPTVALTDRGIVASGAALAPRHGTPVLRVDTRLVEQRYVTLSRALPDVHLHYAVKANPAPQVLRTLQALGCRWDVASPGEIDAVLAAGGDPAQMSYGNTIKKSADIAYAVRRGVRRFTLDSPAELAKISALAPGVTVLIRLATTGAGADWALGSKFGCPESEAARLLAQAQLAGHPVGITFHVGSQQRDPCAWDEPLAATARLRAGLHAAGADLAVVDLGGGFPAATLDAAPFDGRYGAAITSSLGRHLGEDRPELMAEPGRALVADAGVLETEVVWSPNGAESGGCTWTSACSAAWSKPTAKASDTGWRFGGTGSR
jgi:ornithine decarboxylase